MYGRSRYINSRRQSSYRNPRFTSRHRRATRNRSLTVRQARRLVSGNVPYENRVVYRNIRVRARMHS